jgi:phage tail-like protein
MATTVINPYLTYNFLVKWGDSPDPVAAVTSVSGLTHKTAAVSFHAGGQPQRPLKIPGQTDYEPVRLQRGITTDPAFEAWAGKMWSHPNTETLGSEVELASFRKEIQIELYNQAGQLALRYLVHNCWPSEYTALPDLNSESNTVALASLTLEHEGWDRG